MVSVVGLLLVLWVASAAEAQELVMPESAADQVVRARVVAEKEARLSAEISGVIASHHVAEGDEFERGTVLVSMRCNTQNAQLNEANAELDVAVATRDANRSLIKTGSVGNLELAVSEGRVEQAKASVDLAMARTRQCKVIAPFSGVVVKQHRKDSEYVSVSEPLLDILDPSSLQVEFLAPSSWLVWLTPNKPFDVKIDETQEFVSGQLFRIGSRVDPVSQSIRLTGEITSDIADVIPGMSGTLWFRDMP